MRMRFALVVLTALLSPAIANAQNTSPQGAVDSASKVVLKIVPVSATIHSGERLKLRVELWNLGSRSMIIAQYLDAEFGNSALRLFLQRGSMEEVQPGMVADRIPEPNPDFEKTFVTNWLTLNSRHFYGTYVYMDPIDFPHLRKPGHYTVRAEYYSRGIISTPPYNGGYLKQEDIDKLPFEALKGTIQSNTAKIEVKPRKTADSR